ncbi:hypothetical protein ACOSQ3_015436 [Xanthoceras sorbifolium]
MHLPEGLELLGQQLDKHQVSYLKFYSSPLLVRPFLHFSRSIVNLGSCYIGLFLLILGQLVRSWTPSRVSHHYCMLSEGLLARRQLEGTIVSRLTPLQIVRELGHIK